MASLFDNDDDRIAGTVPGLFDSMHGDEATEAVELTDAEEFDLVAQFVRDCMDALPDRLLVNGQLFMRSGDEPIYTNIEDPDDGRIFEFHPDTGDLCQWPACN